MTTPHATATQETGTPEQESRFHTYSSHVIPWYVRFIWLLFWIFAIGYVVSYFLPAFQSELLTPP
ncbi:MAG: hypothetical protein DWI02_04480 [Planctomycetota bacterium]|jgi:hypothetical protein|nr:MAG: hypothetical protein DWI02_04480 [Planctomycetota bacterium]